MSIAVIPAGEKHHKLIALIARLSFAETFAGLFDGYKEELTDYLDATFAVAKIRRSLATPANKYWLAEHDGLPIGYAKLKLPFVDDPARPDRVAELQKIYILRDFQANRAGSQLIRTVERWAALAGAERLQLSVHADNRSAQSFYARQGWQPAGSSRFRIGSRDLSYIVMIRSIEAWPRSF